MASLEQGDGIDLQSSGNDQVTSHEALLNRMAERQAQLRAAQLRRAQQRRENAGTGTEKNHEFLPQFLTSKAAILADLENFAERSSTGQLSTGEITKFLDEIMLRIELLQKSLNEASLYLTPFDSEQARSELKNVNSQFQTKREQLLPTKRFAFSRKPKPAPAPTSQKTEAEQTTKLSGQNLESLEAFDERYSWTDCHGPKTLILPKSDTDLGRNALVGQSVYLADLKGCDVHILSVCGNMIARRLSECRIYTYPVAGSVWIEDCDRCDFILACRQLRIHHTTDSRLGLHMASRPIIEHSTGLHVAPYPLNYPQLSSDLTLAGLSADVNLWQEVEDFSHPNKRMTTGSPNWSILPDSDWDGLKPPVVKSN